jgi:hypothetical protein
MSKRIPLVSSFPMAIKVNEENNNQEILQRTWFAKCHRLGLHSLVQLWLQSVQAAKISADGELLDMIG